MKRTILAAGAAILAIGGTAYAAQPSAQSPGRDANMTAAEAKAKSDAMFTRMDVNGDGKIDAADREERTAERFAQLDTNSDGSLSLEEFSARPSRDDRMARRGGGDRAPGAGGSRGDHDRHGGGKAMMKMADANNDGAVTKAEFDAAHARHFAMMDTNSDGTVTAEERKAARDAMRDRKGATRGGNGPN